MQEIDLKTGLVRVRVAQPRPRRARRLLRLGRARRSRTTRSTTSTSTRSTCSADGDLLDRRAQHVGGLRRRSPRTRPGALAARRQAQQLRAGPGHARRPGSTTPASSPTATITFFDNGATPEGASASRARSTCALDTHAHDRDARAPRRASGKPLVAGSQGNVQALAGGALDGRLGAGRRTSRNSAPAGQLLFDAHLPARYESYRVYRLAWSGRPADAPRSAVALARSGRARRSTRAGTARPTSPPGACSPGRRRSALDAGRRSAPRSGFETAIALPAPPPGSYVAGAGARRRGRRHRRLAARRG